MTDANDTTQPIDSPSQCPRCNAVVTPAAIQCHRCGYVLRTITPPLPSQTAPLIKRRTVWPRETRGHYVLEEAAQVLLQFLPSGRVVALDLNSPVILGRGVSDLEEGIDLSALNAMQHGVSRHHCVIQRRGTHLLALDLGSTNGTFLNGERLIPNQEARIAHGDKLLLGSLHILVSFSNL